MTGVRAAWRWPCLAMKRNHGPLIASVVALVLVTCVYHLLNAKLGYQDYRDQHLGTALEYAKGRIDLWRPIIVGFNANNEPTPLEVPIWQATAALAFKALGPWFGWANLTSLLFFVTGLWPLFQMARHYLGERGAWWTLLFYCAEPLVFYLAGHGGTDGSCMAFALWFLYFADQLARTGQWRWWLPAFAFGTLAAVTKLPFFFCTGLVSVFLLLLHARRVLGRWVQLSTVGLAAGLLFFAWQSYTYRCWAKADLALTDNIAPEEVQNTEMATNMRWYFGSWSYRLNARNWIKGAWRACNATFGSFALAALALWSLVRSRNRLGQFWLGAGLLTTLVFTHLVLHHIHYYLMITPGIALLGAEAATQLEERVGFAAPRRQAVVVFAAAGLLLASTVQGMVGLNVVLDFDPAPRRIAALIRQYTSPNDKLLIQGGGWGGEELFLSDRKGLSIWNTRFLEDPKMLAHIKQLGYTKLVMISESQLHYAVQATKPSQTQLQRDTYAQYLTPVAQGWKTLLQDEDIVVKEIPR